MAPQTSHFHDAGAAGASRIDLVRGGSGPCADVDGIETSVLPAGDAALSPHGPPLAEAAPSQRPSRRPPMLQAMIPRATQKDALRARSISTDGDFPPRCANAWGFDDRDPLTGSGETQLPRPRRKSMFAQVSSTSATPTSRRGSTIDSPQRRSSVMLRLLPSTPSGGRAVEGARSATVDTFCSDPDAPAGRTASGREKRRSILVNMSEGLAMFTSMVETHPAQDSKESDSRKALRAEFDKYDRSKQGRLDQRQMSHLVFARLYAQRRKEAGRRRSINPIGAAVSTCKAFDLSTKLYIADTEASRLVIKSEFEKHNLQSMNFEDFLQWNLRQQKVRERRNAQELEQELAARDADGVTGSSMLDAISSESTPESSPYGSMLARGMSLLSRGMKKGMTSQSLVEPKVTPPQLEGAGRRSASFPVKALAAQRGNFLAMIRQFSTG
eukprot:CAMPEP_0174928048 /NCGR_PEP_ID=MMETSP1355-20121228/22709_1 /TAXON_ID=464990 /ORGANISM="Hemiselmis tepida, Strain CCMP443" /LENGTH=440 /DNA_ID=CAMNT_0016174189 /DNA_START=172 /DNA_END=1490 /DNA_ORIENTATION=-